MSPTTVTGALMWTTLPSLMSSSLVFSQISLSNASPNNCLRSSVDMQESRSKAIVDDEWRTLDGVAEKGQGTL